MYSERVIAIILPQLGDACQDILAQLGEGRDGGSCGKFPAMGKALHKQPTFPNNLKRLRQRREWTQERAAREIGISFGGYKKFEYGERELGATDIEKVSLTYGVSKEQVLDPPKTVPIVGHVGASDVATLYDRGQGPFDEAPMPLNGTIDTVAVEIRGTSLGSLFDRWLVYYNEVQTPPTTDMLRKLCVVGLEDGRVLVKKLLRGSERGLFHLESQTEGLIEDVAVEWAAVVLQIAPR